jgi:hypothetical protein
MTEESDWAAAFAALRDRLDGELREQLDRHLAAGLSLEAAFEKMITDAAARDSAFLSWIADVLAKNTDTDPTTGEPRFPPHDTVMTDAELLDFLKKREKRKP